MSSRLRESICLPVSTVVVAIVVCSYIWISIPKVRVKSALFIFAAFTFTVFYSYPYRTDRPSYFDSNIFLNPFEIPFVLLNASQNYFLNSFVDRCQPEDIHIRSFISCHLINDLSC